MKRKISHLKDEEHCKKTLKIKTYSQYLLSLILFFLLSGLSINSVFAQQTDLRDNPAYTRGKCPANDVQIVSARIVLPNACNNCEPGTQVSGTLYITVHHNTNSDPRYLAVMGDLMESPPNGVPVVTDFFKCSGPLVKSSLEPPGGQVLNFGTITFTCGSTFELSDILLVWTAASANAACPVTLANNPNGKYCWNNPNVIITPPFNATADATDAACFGSATGSIDLTPIGGVEPYTYAWTASNGGVIPSGQADDQDLSGLVAGTYSVVVTGANSCSASVSGIVINQNAETFPDITKAPASANTLCGVSEAEAQAAIDAAFSAWLANATPNNPNDVESNGVVVLNGGAGSYTVTRNPPIPTAPSFDGTDPPTSVTWTITDACGKTDTVTAAFTVNNPCAPVCDKIASSNPLCYGDQTGSITVKASAGFPPYIFYLYDTSNLSVSIANSLPVNNDLNQTFATYTFSGLSGDKEYLVFITDTVDTIPLPDINNDQCTFFIDQPDAALSSQISDVDVLCYGAATGSIDLTPSGGTPPYTYAWSATNGGVIPAGQADDQDLSGLVAGTYSVVITDANGNTGGCRNENSAVISQPAATLSSQISDVDVLCYGAATGSIDLTPSGGTPPYAYAWSATNGGVIPAGQADDQDLSGLVAGTYSVVITDANGNSGGCRATNSAVISQPNAALSSQISDVDVLCFGAATGSIDLTPSGGTPPYAYAWSATNGGVIPAGQADDQDLSGLVAGTYSVVITDANGNSGGCRNENSAVISQPEAGLSATETHVNVLCNGGATGSIDLSPSGGVPPYAYAWSASDGGVIPSGQADDQDLSGLVAGTYEVIITDANGTAGACRATKLVIIIEPDNALSSQISDVDVLCFGAATGSIDLTPSGGTPPYTYAWSATNGGVIPAGQSDDQDLSGLVAGTYSVVITDANGNSGGCRNENSAVISQPAAALSSQISDVDVLCYGGATGSIDLTPSGGTPPYAYAWSATNGGVIPAGQADDQDLSGLVAGTYSVVITDANGNTGGCRNENSAVISQPAAALSSQISDVDVLCYGAATGSIDLTPSGGTPPYAYAWSATNGGVIPAGQADDQDLSGLVAGTYSVVITDANGNTGGCRNENSAVISQPAAALSSQISDVDVLCYGAATGSIDLTPSGGTPPYAYAWSATNGGVIPAGQSDDQDLSGLVAGTYSVVITDANGNSGGCRATNSAVISQPEASLSATETHVNVLCNGGATGSIDLSPSGGVPPYAYAWTASDGGVIPSGQADDQDLSGLVAGTYEVIITDANGNAGGCRATKLVIIIEPDNAISSQISDVDVLCYGAATGSIDLTPSGGTPPYAYAWSATNGGVIPAGQADDQDLSGLVAGTYSVVITDANGNTGGCRNENSTIISQPNAALSLSLSSLPENCAGTATGSIRATFSGGTSPYTVYINGVSAGVVTSPHDFMNLGTNSYTIRVVDDNDCEISDNVNVDLITCGGHIFPTQTTCCNYITGTASSLLNVCTTVKGKVVRNAIPGVFFYYASVVAPAASFSIEVKQSNDGELSKLFEIHGYDKNSLQQIRLFTSSCGNVSFVPSFIDNGKGARLVVNGAIPGENYIISIKYNVKSLLGAVYSGADLNSTYSFASYVNGNLDAGSVGSLDALAGCSDNTPLPGACTVPNAKSDSVTDLFTAFPVPFKENLTIRYDFNYQSKARIEMYDYKGTILMSYDDPDAYQNKEVVLTPTFNLGEGQMYFIKVITDREVSMKKVISNK
ncbi:hypothetical protein LZZ90_07815 [Flavobacterium sp. SM15]|uniref:hypothetical protein n=1 Tax=Flavobacterium sp. SM15 TaxID=2908005 RepID=UPI001EDBB971|nr:hypothetical protein [Flavobacterium sp. SM15]MCG2611410.1 hypothetical protein [Flavobacterium sp. SM15]